MATLERLEWFLIAIWTLIGVGELLLGHTLEGAVVLFVTGLVVWVSPPGVGE